jgi:TRAP-type mannitol/chloroaromatic compound transport system substrate-binding protein
VSVVLFAESLHPPEEIEMTSNTQTKSSRRKFLTGASAAAGAATVGFPMVSFAQTTTLKMQGAWGEKSPFAHMARQYIQRVEEMSGGSLKIEYLVANAVVGTKQIADAVSQRAVDAGHGVTAYWYAKNPTASLFGTGPVYGCNANQIVAWIHYGGGKELYQELFAQMGLDIVGFFCMPMPCQPLGWFKKHIKNSADMKGLKYRTVGLAANVMEKMGLGVAQLPGGEIVPNFQTGRIEAFEFNNPTSDRQFGAQNVSKHYHMSSYHQAAEFFEISFNGAMFRKLAKEHQAILEYAAEAANTANYGWAMDQYSADLQGLIHEDGVNVYRTDTSIMKDMLTAWDKVLDELVEADAFFAKTLESQKAWCERVAFYDLLNAPDYKLAYDHYFPGKLPF